MASCSSSSAIPSSSHASAFASASFSSSSTSLPAPSTSSLASTSASTSATPSPTPSLSHHLSPAVPSRPRVQKGKGKTKVGGATGVKTCEALDRWDEACVEVVVGGHKGKVTRHWCALHETEERKVSEEFLRCTTALRELPTGQFPASAAVLEACDDLDKLEEWEKAARHKFSIVDKALRCRKYHLAHFSAAPDPCPSKSLAISLKHSSDDLEAILTRLNKRSHALILDSEDALWLLSQVPSLAPPSAPPCSSTSNPSLRPPCAPSLQTESEEPDPVEAKEKVKRAELLELLSLTGSHASFIRDGRKSVERVRVIECLFRRLISRDETLLVRAYRGGHDHVLRFFEDPSCCTLKELSRLWAALQKTDVMAIKEAVMDAFRAIKWEESGAGDTEDGEEGMGLQLLGGWTYKTQLGREMDRKEWGHLYDLCGCPGCALRCCVSFAEWAKNRRLTVVPHGTRPPPYLYWGDQKESDAAKIFRALDIVKCSEERVGSESEVRRVGGGFVGAKGKGVFVERQERNWLFLKISITHPKALPILHALATSHAVLVRSRRTLTTPLPSVSLPPPAHLWFSRHRSAPSKADLRHQSWLTDPDGFGPGNANPLLVLSTLDALDSPEIAQGMKPFEETYEVLVLDGFGRDGEGTGLSAMNWVGRTFEQFEAEVGQVVLEGCGCRDVKAALEWGEAESYRRGDLLFAFKGKGKEVKGGKKKAKEKAVDGSPSVLLDSLRDDALAFKLSRSLFR